jgi:hypothetical protein
MLLYTSAKPLCETYELYFMILWNNNVSWTPIGQFWFLLDFLMHLCSTLGQLGNSDHGS